MAWQVVPQSWVENGGDVSWVLQGHDSHGQLREIRAGVRVAARGLLVREASRYMFGDWTAAVLAFACAAAELAAPDAEEAWVSRTNFAAVRQVVEDHRRLGKALFHSGTFKDTRQLGTDDGIRRPPLRSAS